MIQEKIAYLRKMSERTEESVRLAPVAIGFIRWTGKLKEIKAKRKEFEFETTDSEVYFIGSKTDVQDAKVNVLMIVL